MKSIIKYTIALFFLITIFSCSKEKQALNKLDGKYSFYHYEVDFYDQTGLHIDSSWNRNLDGEFLLEQSKDDLPEYHQCTYSFSSIPKGWFDNGVQTRTPFWQTDVSCKTINFFRRVNQGTGINQVQYTVTKKGRKLMLAYLQIRNDGTVYFQERLYLKKK